MHEVSVWEILVMRFSLNTTLMKFLLGQPLFLKF